MTQRLSDPPLSPVPRHGGPTDPSHDDELRRGIIRTRITRSVAWELSAAFVLVIAGVPLLQVAQEQAADEDSVLLDLFRRAPTRAALRQFEEDLESASHLRESVRPRMQELITGRGGFGNVKAVVGQGGSGFLYYKPGVAAVAGPGFLDADVHDSRRRAALDDDTGPVHPDPRPAVLELARALRARGIALVIHPVADKATLQPRELHGRGGPGPLPVAGNRDHQRFVAEMRAAGVLVHDPVPVTIGPGDAPRYLPQDTHWTPTTMHQAAVGLADRIRPLLGPAPRPAGYRTTTQRVQRVGDVVDMLKLPEGQTLFLPQAVDIAVVHDGEGTPWAPSPSAQVLLMGDSFSNIYTNGAMGWGEAAGLGPHLSLVLDRPVDMIAQNDSGAYATRKLLSEALVAGEDRLLGKRVVIWQFAARELATGDWRPYRYAPGSPP